MPRIGIAHMKVLMQIRPDYETKSGGDSVQMLKTKAELENLGIEVDVSTELAPDLSSYQIVHLFNLTRIQETYFQAKNAQRQGKPIALSTIYWPLDVLNARGNRSMKSLLGRVLSADQFEKIKAIAKFFVRKERSEASRYLIKHNFSDMQREAVEMSTVCLPNAETEIIKLNEALRIKVTNYVVVPNAVDYSAAANAAANPSGQYSEFKDFLICVGRIEPRKNQLNLLKAIEGSNYKLLLVGKCAAGQGRYYKKVMREVRRNPHIKYMENIDNVKLYHIYKQCKVSVQPSWFETPGLASLEAASMGCSIVVSVDGTTCDYFGDYALYCDPSSPESIREAIDAAYIAKPGDELANRVLGAFTWKKAAEKTLEGYELAMRMNA